MKIEEVVEALEYLNSDECTDTQADYYQELEAAIEASKKQIPAIPILQEHDHEAYFSKSVKCGACGGFIGGWDYGRAWCNNDKAFFIGQHNYCPLCGQAIDWSEEENK